MKIILAPDSFKECMEARDVCGHLKAGILKACPDADVITLPIADGGEGSAGALCEALSLETQHVSVADPLGRPVTATYCISSSGNIAVIECAQANGLPLLSPEERNPLITSTRGCGEMIRHALQAGAKTIYLCIGGSATVDGGKDLAEAFGYEFLDKAGNPLPPGGGRLTELDRIVIPQSRMWQGTTITVLCDVSNPLLGETGAARVFAPQKGANPEMVEHLEAGLARLALCAERDLGVTSADVPGAGAAGGMGAGLFAFLEAQLKPGADEILNTIGFDRAIAGADLVITGEGRSDVQTLQGKAPQAVALRAKANGVPAYLVSGDISDKGVLAESGVFAGLYSLRLEGEGVAESIAKTPERLSAVAEAMMNSRFQAKKKRTPMVIIAHRGASYDAPENTIPAFELAWKQHADGIEGDFHLTKDGHVVCIHDSDTARVSENNIKVQESTLEQLRLINVGSYRGTQFSNASIPTLQEVLATVPNGGKVYLEVKSGVEVIAPMLSILRQSKVSMAAVTFISFDKDVIRVLKESSKMHRAFLLKSVRKSADGLPEPSADAVLAALREVGADGVSTNTDHIDQGYIASIKQAGYEYHAWTVDDPDRAETLVEWGVDSITTNVPALIRQRLTPSSGEGKS